MQIFFLWKLILRIFCTFFADFRAFCGMNFLPIISTFIFPITFEIVQNTFIIGALEKSQLASSNGTISIIFIRPIWTIFMAITCQIVRNTYWRIVHTLATLEFQTIRATIFGMHTSFSIVGQKSIEKIVKSNYWKINKK